MLFSLASLKYWPTAISKFDMSNFIGSSSNKRSFLMRELETVNASFYIVCFRIVTAYMKIPNFTNRLSAPPNTDVKFGFPQCFRVIW